MDCSHALGFMDWLRNIYPIETESQSDFIIGPAKHQDSPISTVNQTIRRVTLGDKNPVHYSADQEYKSNPSQYI